MTDYEEPPTCPACGGLSGNGEWQKQMAFDRRKYRNACERADMLRDQRDDLQYEASRLRETLARIRDLLDNF